MPEIPIWHVAIRGTPVGPLRRSELAAKLRSGEIEPSSLAWREGQADWQALSAIAELAKLVAAESPRASHVPPAGAFGPGGAAPRATPAPLPAAPTPPPMASARAQVSDPVAQPARTSDPAPQPARASLPPPTAVDDDEPEISTGDDADEESATAAVAHTVTASSDVSARNAAMAELAARAIAASQAGGAAAPPAARVSEPPRPLELSATDRDLPPVRDTGRGPAFWGLVAGAVAFGVVFAWFAAQKAFGPSAASPSTPAHTAPAANPTTPRSAIAATSVEDVGDDEFAAELAGIDAGTGAAAPAPPVAAATTGTRTTTQRPTTGTAESDALPMPVSLGTAMTGASTTGAATSEALGPLQPAQLSSVVHRNLPRAQRCYEIAATMMGRAPDLRLAITIRVSPAGSVTSVDITGADFGGVQACVRRSVMTWVFPPSSTGGTTTIPMVIAGSN